MATIAENLERIQQAKADIKSAIEAKGVTVPSSATIDTYDDYVAQISGGGAATPSNLSDWTYDSFGKITSATIKSGATSIANNAYYGCNSITSITIPDSVTSIGGQAFRECEGLTSIDIPDSVTSIGDVTFYMCNNLKSVTIGSGITTIRFDVFNGCTSLTSVTIQATTPPTLYANAFASTPIANGVGRIYVPDESVDAYKASSGFSAYSAVITCASCGGSTCSEKLCGIDENGDEFTISDDGNGELIESDNIQSYNPVTASIGSGITSIGLHAFYQCGSLTSVTIPNSVTSIGDSAFDECGNLTSVTIGSGVTSIGDYAFEDCNSLTSVTINATTPPTLGDDVFSSTPIENCDGWIYVPDESVMDYQNEPSWNEYQSQIRGISEL